MEVVEVSMADVAAQSLIFTSLDPPSSVPSKMEELHKQLGLLKQEFDQERESALKYYGLYSTLNFSVDEQNALRDALDALVAEKQKLEEDLAKERASNQSSINELATQLALFEAELHTQQPRKAQEEETEWKKLRDECAIAKGELSDAKQEVQDLELERDLAREETERFRYVNLNQEFELGEKVLLLEFAGKGRMELETQVAALKATIKDETEQHRKREEGLSRQLVAVEQRLQEIRQELEAERNARGEEQRLHAALRTEFDVLKVSSAEQRANDDGRMAQMTEETAQLNALLEEMQQALIDKENHLSSQQREIESRDRQVAQLLEQVNMVAAGESERLKEFERVQQAVEEGEKAKKAAEEQLQNERGRWVEERSKFEEEMGTLIVLNEAAVKQVLDELTSIKEKEKARLANEEEAMDEEMREMEEIIENERRALVAVKDQLDARSSECEELRAKVVQLTNEREAFQLTDEEKQQSLLQELESAKAEAVRFEREREAKTHEFEALWTEFAEHKAAHEREEAEWQREKEQLAKYKSLSEEKEREWRILDKQLQDEREQWAERDNAIEELQQTMLAAENRLMVEAKEKEALAESLKETNDRLRAAEQRVAADEDLNRQKHEEVEAVRQRLAQVEEVLRLARAENEVLKESVKEAELLRKELQTGHEELQRSKAEYDMLETKLAEEKRAWTEAVERERKEWEGMRSSNDDSEKRFLVLNRQFEDERETWRTVEEEVNKLRQNVLDKDNRLMVAEKRIYELADALHKREREFADMRSTTESEEGEGSRRLEEYKRKLETTECALNTSRFEADGLRRTLADERDSWKRERGNLRQELDRLQEEAEEREKASKRSAQTIMEKKNEVLVAARENEKIAKKLKEAEENVKRMRRAQEENNSDDNNNGAAAGEQELEEAKAKVSALEDELRSKASQCERLADELRAERQRWEANSQRMASEFEALRELAEETERQLREQSENREAAQALLDKENELMVATRDNARLREKVEDLEDSVRRIAQAREEENHSRLKELEELQASTDAKVAALEDELRSKADLFEKASDELRAERAGREADGQRMTIEFEALQAMAEEIGGKDAAQALLDKENELLAATKDNARLREKMEDLEESVRRIVQAREEEVSSHLKEREEINAKVVLYEEELQAKVALCDKASEELRAEREGRMADGQRMESELEALREVVEETERRLRETERKEGGDHEGMQKEIVQLQQSLAESENLVKRLHQELTELRETAKQLGELEKAIEEMTALMVASEQEHAQKVAQLMGQLEKAGEEENGLRTQLALTEEEKHALQRECARLNEVNDEKGKEMENLQTNLLREMEKMQSDIDTEKLRGEIEEEAKRRFEAKEEELNALRLDFASLQTQMAKDREEWKEERRSVAKEMIELREMLGEEGSRAAALKQELANGEARLLEATREKETLQRDVEEMAKQMEVIQSLVRTQAEEQARAETELKQRMAELEAELTASKAENGDLVSRLDMERKAVKHHQERLDAEMSRMKHESEVRVRQLESDLSEITGTWKQLEVQLAEKTQLCASLQVKIENGLQMQEEMKSFETMLEDLERDNAAQMEQIQALVAENEELSKRVTSTGTTSGGEADVEELEELRRALEEKEQEADSYALKYSEMIQLSRTHERKMKSLETQLKRLQRELDREKAKSSTTTTKAVVEEERPLSISPSSSSSSYSSSSSASLVASSASISAKRPRDVAGAPESSAKEEQPSAAASEAKRLRFTADPPRAPAAESRSRPVLATLGSSSSSSSSSSSTTMGLKRKERVEGAVMVGKENLSMLANLPSSSSSSAAPSSKPAPQVSKKSRKSISQTAAGAPVEGEEGCKNQ